MLEHGGRLRAAAQQYQIPLENWLDLSTGINPNGWPVPAIPAECWQRLPENDDLLLSAAQHYYQTEHLLAVAGSQAAIQALPLLRPFSQVGVLTPAYAEHAACWQKNGHTILRLTPKTIEKKLPFLDVLILINPNNPTGLCFSKEQLLNWHRYLQRKNGWLIVDEAFIDATPKQSLTSEPTRKGLIILRSIGKFFGLAGIRCGFVCAEPDLLKILEEKLGEWPLSHPSRYVATLALQDENWQQQTRQSLQKQSQRLAQVLTAYQLKPTGGSAFFQWCQTHQAQGIHTQLAQTGILTRLFTEPSSLRFGLPKDETQWQRLEQALKNLKPTSLLPNCD